MYFKNAMGVIYVYDITKEDSLESLSKWRETVLNNSNCHSINELLVGNKSDLTNLREVSLEKAKKWSAENDIPMTFETSALLNLGIEDAFLPFITSIIRGMEVKGVRMPIQMEKK